MYLRNEFLCEEILQQVLGISDSILSKLFGELFDGLDAEFHELSCFISDPGSPSQPIHPDTMFTDQAVMYTVFIALQSISADIGSTIFLPKLTKFNPELSQFNPKL